MGLRLLQKGSLDYLISLEPAVQLKHSLLYLVLLVVYVIKKRKLGVSACICILEPQPYKADILLPVPLFPKQDQRCLKHLLGRCKRAFLGHLDCGSGEVVQPQLQGQCLGRPSFLQKPEQNLVGKPQQCLPQHSIIPYILIKSYLVAYRPALMLCSTDSRVLTPCDGKKKF